MCSAATFFYYIYILALFSFGIYLRYIDFQDYFQCYACKEMDFRKEDYDYIIVGSGSAGSIVARRLAEDPNLKILLLEAGSSGNGIMQIPAVGLMLQNSPFDWQYRTVPQKRACLGLKNKVSLWPMGKVLGGTGMLNNMVYVRGHPDDFQRWYQAACNYNYSIDILPYFEKLESIGATKHKTSSFLGDLPYKSNISDFFTQAGVCMGFPVCDNLNAEPGFSNPKLMMYRGQRWTPYHQLMKENTKNLAIVTNAVVEKVLLRNGTVATGVKYTHLDETLQAKARKGVVLCAGAIGTPKILMLSGIGPKNHLKKMKITPYVDLPVGDNLQDHVSTGLDLLTLNFPPNLGLTQMMSPLNFFNYFLRGKGPWTTPGCENIAFFNGIRSDAPELQFMIFPLGVTSDRGAFLRHLVGISDKVWTNYFEKIKRPSFTILPVVLHPKSRGTVRLKNKNPKTPPVIDPNYLSDEYDVGVLVDGIEMIKELVETTPMKRLGVKLNTRLFPGCEHLSFDSREYWECYVRHLTLTTYHPVGTCKMGEVVDYNFEVFGVGKLYVVDGSILPDLPSGNPNGAIMMMAEKAAEVLKHQCWASQRKCCAAEIFDAECACGS